MNANYNVLSGKQDLNIFLKMTNILNEDGRLHTSFIKDRAPIKGRSIMVGFQVDF
jgi:iron complex outermembrane receptor protein